MRENRSDDGLGTTLPSVVFFILDKMPTLETSSSPSQDAAGKGPILVSAQWSRLRMAMTPIFPRADAIETPGPKNHIGSNQNI